MSKIPHYRADIDGLRALAILLVLAFHAFPQSMPGGFVGVDVFFVISGYLITGIVLRGLETDHFSFLHFYAQRARRLLPALMLVLPATLIAGWLWLWPQEYLQLAQHVRAAAVFLLNIQLWMEAGYFDAASELKPLLHLWSLGIEEQFYLIYPCLLWLGWKLTRTHSRTQNRDRNTTEHTPASRKALGPLAAIVALIAASFLANLWLLPRDPAGAFFLPHTRFWELALGGLLAWWAHTSQAKHAQQAQQAQHAKQAQHTPNAQLAQHPHNAHHKKPTPHAALMPQQLAAWLGLLLIATAAATVSAATAYPGIAALLPVGGTLLLIAAGPQAWLNRRLLSCRPLVMIGLISYPLYLWHWPLLSFLHIVQADAPSFGQRLAALALSAVLAWITWRFVETPLRFGTYRRPKLAGTVAGVFLSACAAWVLVSTQGMPSRLPPAAHELAGYHYDYPRSYREGSCFLRPEQPATEFQHCPDPWAAPGQSWLLWGDSHAAHLFPGLHDLYEGQPGLIQRTASGCPPLQDESFPDRPHCAGIQGSVWKEILTHRPARVTLAARWDFYDWRKITGTVEKLRAAGVQQIELVGPVPRWHNGLPRQLAIAYRETQFNRIPERLSQGLVPDAFQLDDDMAALARQLNVRYVSPIQQLCTPEEGCYTHSPSGTGSLLAWDDAHLTEEGSRLAVRPLLHAPGEPG